MKRTYIKEADVKAEVKKLLTQHGWFYWCPPMNGYGASGVSDFNCLRDGVFLALEAKFGTNKPSAMQNRYLIDVHKQGGMSFVVSDRNLDWFAAWLAAFDRAAQAVQQGGDPAPEDGALMVNAIAAMTALIKE
jgi:hypothetical protein